MDRWFYSLCEKLWIKHLNGPIFTMVSFARYKLNVASNKKAMLKLMTEAEKLKKMMSSTESTVKFNIESFMDNKDVDGKMDRACFEELIASDLARIEATLNECLEIPKLKLEDIHSVEIVGGSSRIPSIKKMIEKVFQKAPSTTLNADEAVSRGCAFMCASLVVKHEADMEVVDKIQINESSSSELDQLSFEKLQQMISFESKMGKADKDESDRIELKNSCEELIYKIKRLEDDNVPKSLKQELTAAEVWLEGEMADKATCQKKLARLNEVHKEYEEWMKKPFKINMCLRQPLNISHPSRLEQFVKTEPLASFDLLDVVGVQDMLVNGSEALVPVRLHGYISRFDVDAPQAVSASCARCSGSMMLLDDEEVSHQINFLGYRLNTFEVAFFKLNLSPLAL